MRGNLKRKFTEEEDIASSSSSSPASSGGESDGESASPENHHFTPHSPPPATSVPTHSILKRPKLVSGQNSVHFDQVTVFSFPRCQGFTSVPSHGGATLGMVRRHSGLQRFTVGEHVLERWHRRKERLRDRLREERLGALKQKLITSGTNDQQVVDGLGLDQGLDDDLYVSDSELEEKSFLQPFSSKQRQALLHAAGVHHIDKEEKRQLHDLRLSREACGCDCRGFCEPETCACSLSGIKCQVDRFNFPCGCTKDGCGNMQGRIEFDPRRVQTHYIHTVMRLKLERQLKVESLSSWDQTGVAEEFRQDEDQPEVRSEQSPQEKSCPFGFTLEEDGLPLTMPATPAFHFIPERLNVEENSCSSDMTESSFSSSDSDSGGCLSGGQNLPDVDGHLTHALSLRDSENKVRHNSGTITDSAGAHAVDTFIDNQSRTSMTDYLDENANLDRDFFDEGFPSSPSPSVDYSLCTYMDLSLSSDSGLEFFDIDYPCGPLHSSFKAHRHPDRYRLLELFSSASLPQYESGTHILESLIGLT
ncbi:cysteine/serine-rich nuclear protein 1-like [Pholidichthys leucotaenia]